MKTYFGEIDASSEEISKLIENHLTTTVENDLKVKNSKKGSQVIVGIKGSGKTHLRKKIEAEKSDKDLIFNLDTDNGQFNLDAKTIEDHSGRLKNFISLEILRNLLKHIDGSIKKETTFKTKLDKAFKSGLDILKSIPEAVNVETPYGSIDLKKIFQSDQSSLVQTAWQKILEELLPEIKSYSIYVLIDDAEDVFKNLEHSPDFIEALARSVKDINELSKNKIHVLLFLKKGIWRIWYEDNREYDKVKSIIEFLQWKKEDIIDIITKRISQIHSIEYNKDNRERIWKKEFDFKKDSFDDTTDYMINLIINGPRDIIELANEAKNLVGDNKKITLEDIREIESKYSQDKLYGLKADFGDIFPSIHKFIENVFNGVNAEMTGKEFQEIIESRGITEEKIEKQFKGKKWFEESGKEQIAVMLYKIGFIRVKINGKLYHSIEKADINISEITNNKIQIHPAFRSHLGVN